MAVSSPVRLPEERASSSASSATSALPLLSGATAPRLGSARLAAMRAGVLWAGVASAGAAATGLLGWILNIEGLKAIVPGNAGVKPNAAVALLLAGAALVLLRAGADRRRRRAGWACAGAVLAIGALTLCEYLFHSDLRIDQILFRDPGGVFPGRMAPNTAAVLSMAGVALLLLPTRERKRRVVDLLAIGVVAFAVLALLGYLYDVRALYGFAYFTAMSLPAALAFAVLGVGIFLARPESGMARYLASDSGGGLMLRRVLVPALLLPALLGWLAAMGVSRNFYTSRMDHVLFALALMITLAAIIGWNARSLDRLDSARDRAEHSLRSSRDQWEMTFDCMSEGLSYHNPDYSIVGANDAFHRMLGKKELQDRKCYQVVHGLNAPPDYCPMRRTLASGQTESGEFFEPRLKRYLNVRTDPVLDDSGKVVRIVHVVADVTVKKLAEEATQRLAAIVQSSDDAIFSADLEGRVLTWNPAAERMYGYTEQEILGQSLERLCPADLAGEAISAVAQCAHGERLLTYETQRLRKNGERFDVSMTVSPLHNAAGEIMGASAIARDITEQKRAQQRERQARMEIEAKSAEIAQLNSELEERVRRRTRELEVANRELEAFSYSVSHDLRAPLRSIDGFSQILLEEHKQHLDAEAQEFLGRVRSASQHMGRLIDALLQLSRVTRSEMRCETTDLSALAREVAGELRQGAPERQAEFSIAEGLVADCDPRLMEVLLQNLLENAFKFTSRLPAARIEVGSFQQDNATVYFVRDNGAGFEMEYANKLFGAFQRLHAVSEFEGTGIGLATVQRIINRHGGRIWAEGVPGQGATFYFTLS